MKNIIVIGLGRVGLPQFLVLAANGFNVFGYDIDKNMIEKLSDNKLPFNEPQMQRYLSNTINKTFFPIKQIDSINQKIDAIIWAIGSKLENS